MAITALDAEVTIVMRFVLIIKHFLFHSSTTNVDGTKTLTKGLHKVEFYQREGSGDNYYTLY